MEGSIFVAGAAIKWLRDGLGDQRRRRDGGAGERVPDNHGVYLVPAFVGLGAPHWVPDARGLICGLTLDATGAHLARAALESVAYQTLDLTGDGRDGAQSAAAIRVDGGMAANDWFCQFSRRRPRGPRRAPGGTGDHGARRRLPGGTRDRSVADLEALAATWKAAAVFTPRMAAARRARTGRRLENRTATDTFV